MSQNILEKIESLPPLPRTIKEIEDFRQKRDKEAFELLKIIEKDALIISTLLKVSNSAMFGFRSKVETPNRAINLLGINFTISIAIGGTVQNLLKANLSPYGISSDDFMNASNMATTLANLWLSKISFDLKEELILPSLLQETGKFILAEELESEGKTAQFNMLLQNGKTIAQAEKETLGLTTAEVTANIFKHWKLSDNLINVIEFLDDIEHCEEEFKEKAKYLDVIRTACDVIAPLSDDSIQKALNKARVYNLDTKSLEKAIEKLQDRLLDE